MDSAQPFVLTPALRDCAEDEALRAQRSALHVYIVLHSFLAPDGFRRVKNAALAYTLNMKPHTVARALGLLVSRGYLERRLTTTEGWEYRLLVTRHRTLSLPAKRLGGTVGVSAEKAQLA